MLKIARPRSRTTLVALPQRFLQGDGVRVDLTGSTFISKAGITSSTFKTISDVPVSSFELFLPEGRYFGAGGQRKPVQVGEQAKDADRIRRPERRVDPREHQDRRHRLS
jgi:hypothetical protein